MKGGRARAAALTPGERRRQATEAVSQRWRNRRLAAFMALLKIQGLLARAKIVR